MLRSQWLAKHGAGVGGGSIPGRPGGSWAWGIRVKGGWVPGPSVLYSTAPHILPSPCQDFRVGLQSPSSESREAKGPNVPGSQ